MRISPFVAWTSWFWCFRLWRQLPPLLCVSVLIVAPTVGWLTTGITIGIFISSWRCGEPLLYAFQAQLRLVTASSGIASGLRTRSPLCCKVCAVYSAPSIAYGKDEKVTPACAAVSPSYHDNLVYAIGFSTSFRRSQFMYRLLFCSDNANRNLNFLDHFDEYNFN